MLRRSILAIILAGLPPLAAGCGTVANTVWFTPEEGGKRVYGGVRADLEGCREFIGSDSGPPIRPWFDARFLYFLDLPVSAIADTVTLPYTIPCALWAPTTHAVGRSAQEPRTSQEPFPNYPEPESPTPIGALPR